MEKEKNTNLQSAQSIGKKKKKGWKEEKSKKGRGRGSAYFSRTFLQPAVTISTISV